MSKLLTHDVDSTKLLGNHHDPTSQVGPPQTRLNKQVLEARKVRGAFEGLTLFFKLTMGIELESNQ